MSLSQGLRTLQGKYGGGNPNSCPILSIILFCPHFSFPAYTHPRQNGKSNTKVFKKCPQLYWKIVQRENCSIGPLLAEFKLLTCQCLNIHRVICARWIDTGFPQQILFSSEDCSPQEYPRSITGWDVRVFNCRFFHMWKQSVGSSHGNCVTLPESFLCLMRQTFPKRAS